MKKILALLLAVLMAASLCPVSSAEECYYSFFLTGLDLSFPDRLQDSLGYVMSEEMGALDFGHHVYVAAFTYFSLPRETVRTAIVDPELAEAAVEEIMSHEGIIRLYFATDAGFDAIRTAYDPLYDESYPADYDRAVLLGEAEGFTFYAVPNRYMEGKLASTLTEEYAKDLQEVESALIEGEKSASLHAPMDENKALIGKKLEFTTTDLDGKPVTSQELFSKNKFTLVNVWGTWCGNCMGEMDTLVRLHEKMQPRGCGIVGLNYEREEDPDGPENARKALQEMGATFPNVILPPDVQALCAGYPSTFFVDSEGVLQLCPIYGAKPSNYEPAFEFLLSGGEKAEILQAAGSPAGILGTSFAAKVYTISVKDENGPVKDVVIQFCDSDTCRVGVTDAEGVAQFEAPAGKQYDVHILKVPDGYEADSTVYQTETTYGQMDLTLRKK